MKGPNDCDTTVCPDEAFYIVHWPGQDKKMCVPCAARAQGVGAAMGFRVSLTLLKPIQQPPENLAT